MEIFNHKGVTYWSLRRINEMPKGARIKNVVKFRGAIQHQDGHKYYGYIQTEGFLPLYEAFRLGLVGSKEAYKKSTREMLGEAGA